jgi:polysaccharide export outer membrane protein
MPKTLIKGFTSSPAPKANKRDDLLSKPPDRSPGPVGVALIFIGIGLLASCGVPSQQVLTAQTLATMKAKNSNQELQQQVMMQATKAAVVDYKDYQVGPEDVLGIDILGQDKLSRILRVNGEGEITLPLVGMVKVGGLTVQQIEKSLAKLYDAQFLVDPQITVVVKEFRHQRVAVTGAVEKPGPYEIIGPRTLLEVLALAGGLKGQPSGFVNVIRHQNAPDLAKTMKAGTAQPIVSKTETMVIDLRRLVSGEDPYLNIMVQNGDVVNVPFAGTAYVMGGVKKPGNFPVMGNVTVSQAVALGGGIDPILGTNDITVMRVDEQGTPVSINTNLKSIIARKDPDFPLKDNDVVVVKESTIKKTLYIIRTLLPIPTPSTTF